MTRSRLVIAVALAGLLVAGAVAGLLADPAPPAAAGGDAPPAEARLVLVSGRDDHGMVALHEVPLYDAPDGERVVAEVHDGTLAEVLDYRGTWAQVRMVEGPPMLGWVDDFYLRGELRLVGAPPSCRSDIDGRARPGGTIVVVRELRGDRVRVESVTPPQASGWAARSDLQELPPQGPRCGDVPVDDTAHSH